MGNFQKWLKTNNKLNEADLSSGTQTKVDKATGYMDKVSDSTFKTPEGREQALKGIFQKILSALHIEEGDALKAKSKLKTDVERVLAMISDGAAASGPANSGSGKPLASAAGANVGNTFPGMKNSRKI